MTKTLMGKTPLTKTLMWACWIGLPIALAGWHFGPGQDVLHRDVAAEHIRTAERAADGQDWNAVAVSYAEAQDQWPEGANRGRRQLALAEANARILAGDLIAGQQQMESLLEEMQDDPSADAKLQSSTRHDLATTRYYAAWMMRLEGAETDEWKQEAERARQQFRLLAERAEDVYGDSSDEQRVAQENLEATIRLEQMDLRTLMAKPLPKNCCSNCKGLCKKKRKQSASRSKKKKGGKKDDKKKDKAPNDIRKKLKKTNRAGLFDEEREGS